MYICGRDFTQEIIDKIDYTLKMQPCISRLELSRQVCQWMDWRSPSGQLQDMSCRKALLQLDQRGQIDLPIVERPVEFDYCRNHGIDIVVPEICCALNELGQIDVEPVTSRYCKASKIWFELMQRYHYLGSGPLCGAQIRYLVKSSQYGYIGGLAFSSASFALLNRDKYIGWSEAARRANLNRVVCNDRFLILPTVDVPNLASHVLSIALLRLPYDWQERYSIEPVLIETFVDPSRFSGTCYKAANFIYVGDTSGRRDGIAKNIYLYLLCRKWQKVLCEPPGFVLGQAVRPSEPRHWAEEEFGTVRFFDYRLKERLYTIAQDFYGRPEAGIPEACGSKVRTIGAYRFFSNPKVSMEVILNGHTEATIDRIRQHKVVLAPQDTTILNYSTHPMTEGLGPINNKDNKSIGLILHDTLAFTQDGTPLGVLDAQCWARDPDDKGKRYRRHNLTIEQKESAKWLRSFNKVAEIQKLCPETLLVSIGDRESDIYDLFVEATQNEHGPGLLVRSEKSRNRKSGEEYLWDLMAQKEVSGRLQLHIPRSGCRKARDSIVDIAFSEVELKSPKKQPNMPSVRIWAVYIVEKDFDETVKNPIEWLLLTTVAVNSFEDAQKRVEWYSGRWGIEVYHRTLKSGCRIKDRQLETADRLEACLGIDMVVAWRIYHLTMLGREVPDVACSVFFKEIEWKALCCYVNKTPIAPEKPPTLYNAMVMVACMGGFLGRKNDGFPGTQTLWRGLQRLDTAVEMYAIFTNQKYQHPLKSGP